MISDTEEVNVVIEDNETISVTEGTPTDIAEIMHNEEIRIENENQRIANETQRIENENQRIENETAREEYITDLKQRVLNGEFNGQDGQDGFSPIANVSKLGSTATISITDKNGTTTAEISDGTNGIDGKDGKDGTDGQDGYSPSASVSKVGKIATITITDENGTTTCEIRDGEDGQGSGDMLKSTYDTDNNGIVDNAEKVNNHTVLSDVPANAVFTDTTYTAGTGIDITNNVISSTQSSAEWGNITGDLDDQTDLMTELNKKLEETDLPIQQTFSNYINYSNPLVLDNFVPGKYFLKHPTSEAGNKLCFKALSNSTVYTDSDKKCNFADNIVNIYKKFSEAEIGDIIASIKVGRWAQIAPEQAYFADYWADIAELIITKSSSNDVTTSFAYIYKDGVYDPTVVNGKTNVFLKPQRYENNISIANNYDFTYKKYVDDGLSTKQATIDSTHKLSADLVDDTSTTNKFFSGNYNDLSNKPTIPDELADLSDDSTHRVVTDTEKSTWSGKQDALVSGTNIKTINSTSLLGSGDIEVGADIPQQDTAPSNPQEDDLWIDTDDNTSLVVIDSTVSTTSTNPVQNQAITNYVNSISNHTSYELTDLPAHSFGTNLYQLIKMNKLVSLNCNNIWFNSITANSWLDIAQLPSALYPPQEVNTIGILIDGNSGNSIGYARALITTEGKLRIKANTTNNSLTGCGFSIVWFID